MENEILHGEKIICQITCQLYVALFWGAGVRCYGRRVLQAGQ